MSPRRRWLCVVPVIGLVLALGAPRALAAWSATGTGPAGAAATTMPAGAQPAVSVSGSSVTVRWSAATLPGGAAVSGYIITRINAVNGSAATVGAGCSGIITTTTCTEVVVPSGTWVYTDTPMQDNWTGTASPPSGAASVA